MRIVTLVTAIVLAPIAMLTALFTLELAIGLWRSKKVRGHYADSSVAVVIPAHNEAAAIGSTVLSLKGELPTGGRILVVADNCSDGTAEIATRAGAEVIERVDPFNRGKGFALEFAAEHLKTAPPDVFVVLDADCRMDARSLLALVTAVRSSGRPAQAIYLLRPDQSRSVMVQISSFAFMLKNLVRQRGVHRLTGRAHLTGSGMAMPFNLFSLSRKVRSSIVEDLALGLELGERGHPPILVEDAAVWSDCSSDKGTMSQRRRWEGGFMAVALRQAPREICTGIRRGDFGAIVLGLDLMIPPLALFGIANAAVVGAAALFTVASGAAWWPVIVQVGLLAIALAAIFVAWLCEGRDYISLRTLARLPLYILWKLPMYLGLARRGAPSEWVRTER